jgi:predicted kinase
MSSQLWRQAFELALPDRRLLPARQACYKCNMRRWMRDRGKRRKSQDDKPGQENPAPLQPKFPDPNAAEVDGNRDPDFAAQAETPAEPPTTSPEAQPTGTPSGGEEASQQLRRDRNRRRGRRGRGGRPQPAAQTPALPGPGGPTGEAGEAEGPIEAGEPAAVAPAAPRPPAPHETKKSKGAVVLSIGLPGSGKSTWFKRHNILPLSSDMVRILLFDDATEQRYQDLVFSTLRSMLRARLLARRPWNYVDATNLSPHERRSWIKLAHDFGYEAHAVFFDVPPEVCIERNRRRERNVPEDVMQRMAAKQRPPKFEEGFAKITVVRLRKKDGEGGIAAETRQEPETQADESEPSNVADTEY